MRSNSRLIIPEPVSAGLLLTYKCNSGCKHCMYDCSPKWDEDWISQEDVDTYLSLLSGKIKSSIYGLDHIDLNSGLHFTGGEPFLNFELLLRATEIARIYNIPSTFVETNCYWCTDDKETEERMRHLKRAGLNGIMISVNPFLLEHVPFVKTLRAIKIAKRIFGKNTLVYQPFFYSQFKRLGVASTLTFSDYTNRIGIGGLNHAEVIPMGRLPYQLGYLFQKHPAQSFFGQSCSGRLTSPHHVHIEYYGNYIGGFCGGISLGDCHDPNFFFNGINLNERPVLKALVTDIEELYRLGKEFQYEDIAEGYTSACHLCLDIRKHFVQQSNNFIELTPAQMYTQF